jgi:phosphoglycolate phosphatase-like HAD superfamily hydrolase
MPSIVSAMSRADKRDGRLRSQGDFPHNAAMAIPDILALDFDGVVCDGMREYFETSRRAYARAWPDAPAPGEHLFPAFRRLRPVIFAGWEMPLLVRAIALGRPEADVLARWADVRDAVAASDSRPHDALVALLKSAIDDVRRDWIAQDQKAWLALNVPYEPVDALRRLVTEPGRCVIVTTKEGEFTRQILDAWQVQVADVQGKEAGTHKCDNLRALITAQEKSTGRRPRLWFVEDRLETLEHVTTHADLADVGLYLAAWGYNTEETRATAARSQRVRLLELAQFEKGLEAWPS